jgi:glycosyltransferase involved in cell wall biosynthesis
MKILKIIINGRFLLHRVTGVERYAREIIAELDKIVKPGEIMMAVPPEVENVPDYKNIKIRRTGKLHNRLWEHISFPCFVHKEKGISLNLCNVAPLPSPGIVCIHDVKVKATPQYFSKKFLLWYNLLLTNAAKRAKAIITVSEFSKKEICKYFHVKENKITVIPNAWQHYERIGYDENTLYKYELKKDRYYFSMFSLEPNKNFKWIAEVAKRNPDETFAVAGSINKDIFAEGLGFECPDNMKLLGYVSDEEAKTLMRDCKAFLFPTFYEGFGIPPLEAISAGARRVVVSDTDVMHEIFGDSVIYVDPKDYGVDLNSIINKNEYIWTNSEELLRIYDWKKSASDLYAMIGQR